MRSNDRTYALPASRPWATLWLLLGALSVAAVASSWRPAAAQDAAGAAPLSAQQLQELVGPIALYPDDLVGIVLPAATYPLQIVEAARFLDDRKNDASLKPDEDWDDSVVALLNYPEVVTLLNSDLDWTWELGTAVLSQRADVLDAIQTFRDRAQSAGNLRTDERQIVTEDADGTIEIAPANPEVVYVPYYEPRRVVVYQTVPVYHYYPWGYPLYYYPYPADYTFGTGLFWGVTSVFAIGWHSHVLHYYSYGHYGHPYYGWNYYDPFYARSYVNVNVNVYRGDVWQPRYRYGSRPIVRGQEGRVVNTGREPHVSHGVAGSAYRGRDAKSAANRAPTTQRAPSRGVGANAGSNRRPSTTTAPNGSLANRDSANRTTASEQYRAGRGMAQAQRQDRTQAAPQEESRSGATLRSPTPAGTNRTSRTYVYRGPRSSAEGTASASARTSSGAGNAASQSGGSERSREPAASSARTYRAPSQSAPTYRAPSQSAPTYRGPTSRSRDTVGASRSNGGGSDRSGGHTGGRQAQPSRGDYRGSRSGAR